MKRWKMLMVLSVLGVSLMAVTSPHMSVEHTRRNVIALADIGDDSINTDTFTQYRKMPTDFPVIAYDRQINITSIDTVFGLDSLRFKLWFGPTKAGPWVAFDELAIALPTSSVDSLVNVAVSIDMDSTDATRNARWFRLDAVNVFSTGDAAADTLIVGNVYQYHWEYYMTPSYQPEPDSLDMED